MSVLKAKRYFQLTKNSSKEDLIEKVETEIVAHIECDEDLTVLVDAGDFAHYNKCNIYITNADAEDSRNHKINYHVPKVHNIEKASKVFN